MNIQHVFAHNMKALRKQRGLTQEELSEKSNLHRTYIGGIEQERINVSLKNIGKIANALDTNPAFFFVDLAALEHDEVASKSHTKNAFSSHSEQLPHNDNSGDDTTIYSLCVQKGAEMSIQPIKIENINLDLQILCSLIQSGYAEGELAQRYEKTKLELFEYFHYSSQEQHNLDLENWEKEMAMYHQVRMNSLINECEWCMFPAFGRDLRFSEPGKIRYNHIRSICRLYYRGK